MAVKRVELEYRSTGGDRLKAEAQGIGDAAARGFRKAEDEARKAARGVSTHLKVISATSREVRTEVDMLTSRLGVAGAALKAIGPAGLAIGAAAAGVGILGAAVAKLTVDAVRNADALGDQAAKIGISVEALQQYRFTAIQVGQTQAEVDRALQVGTRTIGQLQLGTGALVNTLKKLDPAFLETVRGATSTEDAIGLILGKIRELPGQMEKAALAQAAFGRSGGGMTLLASEYETLSARARELGIILSTEQVAAADKAADELEVLSAVVKGRMTVAFVDGAPAVFEMAQGLVELAVRAAQATEDVLVLTGAISKSVPYQLRKVREEINAAKQERREYAGTSYGDEHPRVGVLDQRVRDLRREEERLQGVQTAEAEKRRKALAAEREAVAAEQARVRGVAEATKAAKDAEKEAARSAKKAASEALAEEKRAAQERERLLDRLTQARQDATKAGLEGEALIRAKQEESVEDFAREVAAAQEHLTKLGVDGATLTAEFRAQAEAKANAEIGKLRQDAAEKLAEQQLREAEKLAEQQQKLIQEPVRNAIESTQNALVNMALATNASWADLGDNIIGMIKRIAVEWAAARLFQTVLGELGGGTGAGLLGGLFGGGTASAPATIPVTLSSGQTVSIPVSSGGGVSLPSGGGSGTGTLLSLGGTAGKFAFQQSGAGNYLSRLLGFGGAASSLGAASYSLAAAPLAGVPAAFGGAGLAAGITGAGSVLAPAVAANGGLLLPGITQAAGSGVLAAGSGLGLNAAGQVVPITQGGTSAAAGAGGSVLGTAVAGIGAAIALALATKGLIDDRNAYDQVTLGADQGAKNRLTGIGASQIAIGTGIGAGVGTAILPGIGTLVGAGLGAAVGAAVSQAIASSTVKGISNSFGDARGNFRSGLNQADLEESVKDELRTNIALLVLGGAAHVLVTELLGGLVTPDADKIVEKIFRGVLGRAGLNTAGVGRGNRLYGTGLGQDGLTAARLIGSTYAASGIDDQDRLGNLRGILLGGVAQRARRREEEPAQALAEVFTAAFGRVLARPFRTIEREPKLLREGDIAFTAEQFARSTGLATLIPLMAKFYAEGGAPSGKAVGRSREAVGDAIGSALQSAAESDAFIRSMAGSIRTAFAEGASKALARGPVGEAFAKLFELDKDNRKAFRRARRAGNVDDQIDILTTDFLEDVDRFAALIADPNILGSIEKLDDALLKLDVSTALVTDGVAGAAAVITAELQPLIDTVRGYQQLGRDVTSRVGFALAGPGFAGEAERLRELTRTREDAARALTSSDAFGALRGIGSDVLDRNLGRGVGFVAPDDIESALPLLQAYGEARLTELEAELALQRQIVEAMEQSKDAARGIRDTIEGLLGRGDGGAQALRAFDRAQTDFRALDYDLPETIAKAIESVQAGVTAVGNRYQFLTGAAEGFGAFADQTDVRRRGARALREQLSERERELDRLLPIALRGGAGSDDAIAKLSRLLPEVQQLGSQLLSPSAQRRQDAELRDVALKLEQAAGDGASVAERQLEALERMAIAMEGDATSGLAGANAKLEDLKTEAGAFREAFSKLAANLEGEAAIKLTMRHQAIADLLGESGEAASPILAALNDVGASIDALIKNGKAGGGPVRAGGAYLVGERGPELFAPDTNGVIYPNGSRVQARAGNVLHVSFGDIVIHAAPGTTPRQMHEFARSAQAGRDAELADWAKRHGFDVGALRRVG